MNSTKMVLEIAAITGFIVVFGSVPLVLKRFQKLNLGFRLLYDGLFILLFAGLFLATSPAFDKPSGLLELVGFALILATFNWYVKSMTTK